MTTYRVTSDETGHHLIASWPDVPEPVAAEVGTFGEAKLAGAARRVLDAASRFRWHRALQLWMSEVGPEEQVAGSLPQLPTAAVLGGVPMAGDLKAAIEQERGDGGDEHPLRLGNLAPLAWTDWRDHLSSEERGRLTAELEADLAAIEGDYLTGRGRQFAWYLGADLLVGLQPAPGEEPHVVDSGQGDIGTEPAVAERCARLLGDLTGLEIEQFTDENELLVHTPATTVEFEKAQGADEGWVYWSPDRPEAFPFHENWQHEGDLPAGLTVGALASFIVEKVAEGSWPFGGEQPPGGTPPGEQPPGETPPGGTPPGEPLRGLRNLWQRGR